MRQVFEESSVRQVFEESSLRYIEESILIVRITDLKYLVLMKLKNYV
jgi:hypothetical protein